MNIIQRLQRWRSQGLIRTRYCNDHSLINFCSNDYLNLSKHPSVIRAGKEALEKYGAGATASPLVSGYHAIHQELEEDFSRFIGSEKALLFSSGYLANLGVINALTDRYSIIFSDKLVHASIIDACQLSKATVIRYQHNNLSHLEEQLKQFPHAKKIIVTDAVFSSTGVMADLFSLKKLVDQYSGLLIIDDAHGIGVLAGGKGSLAHHQLNFDNNLLAIYPLGKAFGAMGALVAGHATWIDGLIQFSRTYMFSTAIAPVLAASAHQSLQLMKQESWRSQRLIELISHFKKCAQNYQLPLLASDSAIQSIMIGDAEKAVNLQNILREKGYWIGVFRPPSVPEGQSLLRITLNAEHTLEQIEELLKLVRELK